jgi:hypothetical protein
MTAIAPLDACEADTSGSSDREWGCPLPSVKARLNATLPHTTSQVDMLWVLLDRLYGRDESFTRAVDGYLDGYRAERAQAGAS